MKIIWAFGDDSTFTKHSDSNRGINEAKFVSKVGAVDAGSNLTSDPNVITLDFKMNVEIGSKQETNYICRSFPIPDDIKTGSIYKFSPILDQGPSNKMLHHLILRKC